jgi:hypothetical protein
LSKSEAFGIAILQVHRNFEIAMSTANHLVGT